MGFEMAVGVIVIDSEEKLDVFEVVLLDEVVDLLRDALGILLK